MKKLVILTLLVLSALLIACAKEDLPPSPPAPGAVGGGAFAGRAVFTGGQGEYAEDTADFFSISSDTPAYGETLTATCQGNQFIYAAGYDTDVNGQWREFEYDCERVGSSNWCRSSAGPATAERPVNTDNYVADDNYILCYGCTKEAGQWNCHWAFAGGGGRWMAHTFNVQPAALAECGDGDVDGGEDCLSCPADAGCSEGQFCDAQAKTCVEMGNCVAEGCPTGQTCNEQTGMCAGCITDDDCPQDGLQQLTCDTSDGLCKVPPCTDDESCPEGHTCNTGTGNCDMVGGCDGNEDCGGLLCDTTTGACNDCTDESCQAVGGWENSFCNTDTGQCELFPEVTGPAAVP